MKQNEFEMPPQGHVLKLTSHFGRLAGGSRSLGQVISGLLSLALSFLCAPPCEEAAPTLHSHHDGWISLDALSPNKLP